MQPRTLWSMSWLPWANTFTISLPDMRNLLKSSSFTWPSPCWGNGDIEHGLGLRSWWDFVGKRFNLIRKLIVKSYYVEQRVPTPDSLKKSEHQLPQEGFMLRSVPTAMYVYLDGECNFVFSCSGARCAHQPAINQHV